MKKNRKNKFHLFHRLCSYDSAVSKKPDRNPAYKIPVPCPKKDASNMTKNFFLNNRYKMKKDRVLEYSKSLPFLPFFLYLVT